MFPKYENKGIWSNNNALNINLGYIRININSGYGLVLKTVYNVKMDCIIKSKCTKSCVNLKKVRLLLSFGFFRPLQTKPIDNLFCL